MNRMPRNRSILSLALLLAMPLVATAQSGPATPPPARGIIVQGGLVASPATDGDCVDGAGDPRSSGATDMAAIGPKQDDPRASGAGGTVALGPKQDDPHAMGRTGMLAIGPKQDDPRASSTDAVAIGPKQDDPRAKGASDGPAMGGHRPATASAARRCVKSKP